MRVATAFGITAAFFAVVVLRADQHAEFAFDHAIMFVRVFDDLSADLDVLLERLVAGVDHHAGEAFIDAFLAEFEGIAVVEVDRNWDVGEADRGFDQFLEVNRVGVLPRAFGDLEHHGRFFLFAGLDDGLEQLHVVDVERAEAYLPLSALANRSRVCVSGMIFDFRCC